MRTETMWRPGLKTYGMFEIRSMRFFALLLTMLTLCGTPRAAFAQAPTNQELLQRISALESQLAELKRLVNAQPAAVEVPKAAEVKADEATPGDRLLSNFRSARIPDMCSPVNFPQRVGTR